VSRSLTITYFILRCKFCKLSNETLCPFKYYRPVSDYKMSKFTEHYGAKGCKSFRDRGGNVLSIKDSFALKRKREEEAQVKTAKIEEETLRKTGLQVMSALETAVVCGEAFTKVQKWRTWASSYGLGHDDQPWAGKSYLSEELLPYLAKAYKTKLKQAMKDVPFCLIVDGSTDVTILKQLVVLARTFDKTYFLALVEISNETGINCFNTIKAVLEDLEIQLKYCIGLSSDGASNMCGRSNGLISHLEEAVKNARGSSTERLYHVHCLCHRVQLSVNDIYSLRGEAGEFLRQVDQLSRSTYNFFKNSSNSRKEYKQLEQHFGPLAFPVQLHNIRWAGKFRSLSVIVKHSQALKQFVLENVERRSTPDGIQVLSILQEHEVRLAKLLELLGHVHKLSVYLQKEDITVWKAFELCEAAAIRIQNVSGLDDKMKHIARLLTEKMVDRIPRDEAISFRAFQDFGEGMKVDGQILKDSIHSIMTSSRTLFVDADTSDDDFQKLMKEVFIEFRVAELSSENSTLLTGLNNSEHLSFQLLAKIVLAMSPSSAAAERVFSQVNLIKTSLRNRLKSETLNSLLSIKLSNFTNLAPDALELWISDKERRQRGRNEVNDTLEVDSDEDEELKDLQKDAPAVFRVNGGVPLNTKDDIDYGWKALTEEAIEIDKRQRTIREVEPPRLINDVISIDSHKWNCRICDESNDLGQLECQFCGIARRRGRDLKL
jgi:hypothetical protein